MLVFKKLELADIEILRPFFSFAKNHACDNTNGGTIMWRDFFHAEYAIYKETMILKVKYLNGNTAFSFPLGRNITECLEQLEEYCEQQNLPLIFCTVTPDDKIVLEDKFKNYNITANQERDWFDYLYHVKDLYDLAGRKYSGQRNHINYFKKNYPDYKFEIIEDTNTSEVKEFYKNSPIFASKNTNIFLEERNKVFEVLDNYALYGLMGGLIRADNQIVAFAIGEIVNDTLFVHIEKANSEYRGAYQMIVNEFVRHFSDSNVNFVNREEDVGDEGLRTSKLSYHPCNLIEKYTVIIK
jgi:hypothetical protein